MDSDPNSQQHRRGFRSSFELILRFLGIATAVLAPYLSVLTFIPGLARSLHGHAPYAILLAAACGIGGTVYWKPLEEVLEERVPLQYTLEGAIRYFLAYVFVTYGFAKFFRTQLYEPFLYWQDTPVGELTGFQLTWTFFGSSFAYSTFIGATQVFCAGLLLFRRTQLLGALLLLPVVSNIVFVNFAYDIPVKFPSAVFLIMTIYLVMTEFDRLKGFFWDNHSISPRQDVVLSPRKLVLSLKWGFIVILIAGTTWRFSSIVSQEPYVERPVVGIWDVSSFESNGETLYERQNTGGAWTKLIFEAQFGGDQAVVRTQDGSTLGEYTVDPARGKLEIYGRGMSFVGTYELLTDYSMVLTGRHGDDSVRVELLRRTDAELF